MMVAELVWLVRGAPISGAGAVVGCAGYVVWALLVLAWAGPRLITNRPGAPAPAQPRTASPAA